MEAMRFGGALQSIPKQFLTVDLCLGPVYLRKVDLVNAYMRLWLIMEDVPSIDLLVHKKNTRDTKLVGSHLLIPMGYIDSAPYFCMAKETVAELTNEAIAQRKQVGKYSLELAAKSRSADNVGATTVKADDSWTILPAEQCSAATSIFNIYLEEFTSVVQRGPR